MMQRLLLLALAVLISASSTCEAYAFAPGPLSFRGAPTTASIASPTRYRRHHSTSTWWNRRAASKDQEEDAGDEEEEEDHPVPVKSPDAASDILQSPAFLKRKLEVLQNDVKKAEESLEEAKKRLEAGKKEWGPQLEDLQKEYQNIQDRMSSQSKQGDSQATIAVVRKMLDVLDIYDRAFGAVTPSTDAEEAIEAEYKETYGMILAAFTELGVEEIETVGKEFDYEFHQAVMQRPSEYEEGIVCEELQKGFKLGDQLIRASMVAVAA